MITNLPDVATPLLGLNETQKELYEMAKQFADQELAPYASEWDSKEFFPIDTMKKAAELGFGAVFVKEDVGGSGMTRYDGSIIFEALSSG